MVLPTATGSAGVSFSKTTDESHCGRLRPSMRKSKTSARGRSIVTVSLTVNIELLADGCACPTLTRGPTVVGRNILSTADRSALRIASTVGIRR